MNETFSTKIANGYIKFIPSNENVILEAYSILPAVYYDMTNHKKYEQKTLLKKPVRLEMPIKNILKLYVKMHNYEDFDTINIYSTDEKARIFLFRNTSKGDIGINVVDPSIPALALNFITPNSREFMLTMINLRKILSDLPVYTYGVKVKGNMNVRFVYYKNINKLEIDVIDGKDKENFQRITILDDKIEELKEFAKIYVNHKSAYIHSFNIEESFVLLKSGELSVGNLVVKTGILKDLNIVFGL